MPLKGCLELCLYGKRAGITNIPDPTTSDSVTWSAPLWCQERLRCHKACNDHHKVTQVFGLAWAALCQNSPHRSRMGLTKKGKILLTSLATLLALASITAFAVSVGNFGPKLTKLQSSVSFF